MIFEFRDRSDNNLNNSGWTWVLLIFDGQIYEITVIKQKKMWWFEENLSAPKFNLVIFLGDLSDALPPHPHQTFLLRSEAVLNSRDFQ